MSWPLLLALASPQQSAPDTDRPIVITGIRLSDAKRRLAACIARACPPDEDAKAALAVAETEFVSGDYAASRITIADAIGRNRKHAKAYPVPVSLLYRARGRVAAHLGEYDERDQAVFATYRVLKGGLPPEHPQVIGMQIELGDLRMVTNRLSIAEDHYRDTIEQAEAAGLAGIAAIARFRLASLIAGPSYKTPTAAQERRAAAILDPLVRAPAPNADYSLAARIFAARVAERRGQKGAVDAVLREIPASLRATPVLLSSTPIKLDRRTAQASHNVDRLAWNAQRKNQWIDVGFWIAPEGNVRDAEVLREGSPATADWHGLVLDSINSRRYSAAGVSGENPGLYRVERYSLTAPTVGPSGTNIRIKGSETKIEVLDLTEEGTTQR